MFVVWKVVCCYNVCCVGLKMIDLSYVYGIEGCVFW